MAAKTRINITFDPETLRLADREARRRKTSRRDLIRAAIRALASEAQRQQADAGRQQGNARPSR